MGAEQAVDPDVVVVQAVLRVVVGRCRQREHVLDRPPKVHDRGAGGVERGRSLIQRLAVAGGEGDAVGGGDADDRHAAHHHVSDGSGGLGGVRAGAPGDLGRQGALVEQSQASLVEADRRLQCLSKDDKAATTLRCRSS